jgi:hypothetical protein
MPREHEELLRAAKALLDNGFKAPKTSFRQWFSLSYPQVILTSRS